MNRQLKKGVLDLLVLATLEHADRYGFELVQLISRHVRIAERTIYPLLKRLRDDGLVVAHLEESSMGASRKYYRLTDHGSTYLRGLKEEWNELHTAVNRLLEEAANEPEQK